MAKHKHIDRICCIITVLTFLITILFMNGASLGLEPADHVLGYAHRLFDQSRVHSIDLVTEDWDGFIETCTNEAYVLCNAVIDGEAYKRIGIRAKGNTSLSSVASYGNDRYSFKIEFDQYDSSGSYYGLDKLCLNNLIQDNTYLKDYLSYNMMRDMGVAAPLCSFAWITVNGADWGLYLAVEAVEEGFLQRNYGKDYGELYKPDSMNMDDRALPPEDSDGTDQRNGEIPEGFPLPEDSDGTGQRNGEIPEGFEPPTSGRQLPEDFAPSAERAPHPGGFPEGGGRQMPEGFEPSAGPEAGDGGFGGRGSSDVMLQYIDDNPDSYANIFDHAKTKPSDADRTRLIQALKTLGEAPAQAVDIDGVIRYLVVHDFVQNADSYTGSMVHNYYLHEDNGVLSMIPWDYNLAFGTFGEMGADRGAEEGSEKGSEKDSGESGMTSTVNAPIDSPVSGGDLPSRPMVSWIFENEAYTALYHQIYGEFIAEFFDNGYFEQLLSDVTALISPYVEKEPAPFCSYEAFTKAVPTLREFCRLRAESVSGQLAGRIPSTREGQAADGSLRIDASHLNASDLGDMRGGKSLPFAAVP